MFLKSRPPISFIYIRFHTFFHTFPHAGNDVMVTLSCDICYLYRDILHSLIELGQQNLVRFKVHEKSWATMFLKKNDYNMQIRITKDSGV